jgi:hypothetical protein
VQALKAFAAGALFQFIPTDTHVNFYSFCVIYIVSCVFGIISHSPGGIGVFESSIMHALPDIAPQSALAGLFMFRIVYYLFPLILTIILLFFDQKSRQWSGIKEVIYLDDYNKYPEANKVLDLVFFVGCAPTISEENIIYIEQILNKYSI